MAYDPQFKENCVKQFMLEPISSLRKQLARLVENNTSFVTQQVIREALRRKTQNAS
jgi:hypothetical protein